MRTKHLVAILVLLALALPASPAHAGGIVTICDEAHLRAALAGGGMVTFACSGTIALTAEITIAADTTIDGIGESVTISGNHAVRVFSVNSGVSLNLNELTVANGNAYVGGGIYNYYGTLTVSNSNFSDNNATYMGGGFSNAYGTVEVTNSTFSDNSAYVGGSISNAWSFTVNATLTVSNSTFTGNSANNQGGGIYNEAMLSVSNSIFSGNAAWDGGALGAGGGIFNEISGMLTVSNSAFSGNSAGGAVGGGGIYNEGMLTLRNSAFSGNRAGEDGGGIYNDGVAKVSNSTFADHDAFHGGGIYNNDYRTLDVSDSTFSDNEAGVGGGISNGDFGTVNVNNSTFFGNGWASEGGGISNDPYAILTVSNSTFSGNGAMYGGGIDNRHGEVTVSNSTFAGNYADCYGCYGGGIANSDFGTLNVSNSTFSGNYAYNGGGIANYGDAVTLKNAIVASPTGGNCFGVITDGGGNLSYPDATCPGINADPLLGPLQNNGGPTETMALGMGSAAIDAADDAICAAPPVDNLDQRGVVRPQGPHCDIGAVEQIFEPTAVNLNTLSARSLPGAAQPLVIAGLVLAALVGPGSSASGERVNAPGRPLTHSQRTKREGMGIPFRGRYHVSP